MSFVLMEANPDLKRLRDDSYEVSIVGGYLVLDIPYVTTEAKVAWGRLVSTLNLQGDWTAAPDTHVAMFAGSRPCHKDGTPLDGFGIGEAHQQLTEGLAIDFTLSAKPQSGGYPDYYAKMSNYATLLSGPAEALDSAVTAKRFAVIETSEDESVFKYLDTFTSRAGIGVASAKLKLPKVAILGAGGTGAYVLDQVAKTPVNEIHLYDSDRFFTHNAFRAPGAPSLDELRAAPTKVARFASIYSEMHRGIVPHEYRITAENVAELDDMAFVFICVDEGADMRPVIEHLQARRIPFVDTGIGVYDADGSLGGVLRVTASTPRMQDHIWTKNRIPLDDLVVPNEYARNIQVADLNMLIAAFAVLRWKRLFGFYLDLEDEHFSTYTINGNQLLNEDKPLDEDKLTSDDNGLREEAA